MDNVPIAVAGQIVANDWFGIFNPSLFAFKVDYVATAHDDVVATIDYMVGCSFVEAFNLIVPVIPGYWETSVLYKFTSDGEFNIEYDDTFTSLHEAQYPVIMAGAIHPPYRSDAPFDGFTVASPVAEPVGHVYEAQGSVSTLGPILNSSVGGLNIGFDAYEYFYLDDYEDIPPLRVSVEGIGSILLDAS